MLLRETAPPWWEDLNLGLPGKGSHWLGGPAATSELAACRSTDALLRPTPREMSILGFLLVMSLRPLSEALGTSKDWGAHPSEPTISAACAQPGSLPLWYVTPPSFEVLNHEGLSV